MQLILFLKQQTVYYIGYSVREV